MVIAIITIIIIGIGVFVAIRALQHRNRTSIEEQRPQLKLEPVAGHKVERSGDRVTFSLPIRMENTGKTPAVNITSLDSWTRVILSSGDSRIIDIDTSGVVKSLSPSMAVIILTSSYLSFPDKPDAPGKVMDKWKKGELYILINMSLKYKGVSSKDEYPVSIRCRMDNQGITIESYSAE